MRTRLTCILISALLAALAIPTFAATEIIPSAVGNKWEYDCYKLMRATIQKDGKSIGGMRDTLSGGSVYEVVSVDSSGGKPVFYYTENTEYASSSGDTQTDKSELKYTVDDTALRITFASEDSGGDKGPDKQTYDPPLTYWMKNAAPGVAWDVGVIRDEETSTPVRAQAVGKETVTVPAGTFKDCLKVIYSSDQVTGTIEVWKTTFTVTSGRSRGVYWIADGVGVVKELEVSTSSAKGTGPDGKPIVIEGASCVVSELKPGYVVKK